MIFTVLLFTVEFSSGVSFHVPHREPLKSFLSTTRSLAGLFLRLNTLLIVVPVGLTRHVPSFQSAFGSFQNPALLKSGPVSWMPPAL